MSLLLTDERATERLAEDIAAVLKAGDLIALSGGLGAGKTTFARALIRALSGDPSLEVQSPTFPLRIDHPLPRIPVIHVDLYRIGDARELEELGLEEAVADGALVVEWPERLPSDISAERLDIALEIAGTGRSANVIGKGTWPARLERTAAIRAFLDNAEWRDARRTPLAGDASYRVYESVSAKAGEEGKTLLQQVPHPRSGGGGPPAKSGVPDLAEYGSRTRQRPSSVAVEGASDERRASGRPLHHASHGPPPPSQATEEEPSAILMNAPARIEGPRIYAGRSYDAVAHRAMDVRAFVAIGNALRDAGIRTPEIFAADMERGLLLLENLGNDVIVDPSGAPIIERYEASIDLLAFMHGRERPDEAPLPDGTTFQLPPYDRDALLIEVSLFPDWFGGHGGEPAFPKERRDEFLAEWAKLLDSIDSTDTTWTLRDFHSPNILWQKNASGLARVGIIDFQDALIGHPAYDVASLAQDARVPLSEDQEARLRARYIAARSAADPRFDEPAFLRAYSILGLQRATKVLGIFTRLALAEGKPGYQRHRARLKALIRRNLTDPVLSPLRLWYEPYL